MAINDLVVVRAGPGQVLVSVAIDGELYARAAGDGLVVATELGSSAYNMQRAARSWLPPSMGSPSPRWPRTGARRRRSWPRGRAGSLEVEPGYGGVRYELDGRDSEIRGDELTVARRETYATLVTLADEEPRFTGLRRRGLLLDSPRVLVRDERPDNDPEHRPV